MEKDRRSRTEIRQPTREEAKVAIERIAYYTPRVRPDFGRISKKCRNAVINLATSTGRARCVVTGEDFALVLCHILDRATGAEIVSYSKLTSVIRTNDSYSQLDSVEFCWGMAHETLHVDTKYNLILRMCNSPL